MPNPSLRHPDDPGPVENTEIPSTDQKEDALTALVHQKIEPVTRQARSGSVDDALRRLHIRISRLNTTSPASPVLKRLTTALLALDAGITRIGRRESQLSDVSTLAELFQNFDAICLSLETPTARPSDQPAVPPQAPSDKTMPSQKNLIENRFDHIDQCLKDTTIRLHHLGQEQSVLKTELTGHMTTLRENQKADGRKLIASMGAIHAALELCVSRLSGVERALNDADLDQAARPTKPSGAEHLNPIPPISNFDNERSIDPRSALAAARAAAARALYREDRTVALSPSTAT